MMRGMCMGVWLAARCQMTKYILLLLLLLLLLMSLKDGDRRRVAIGYLRAADICC